MTYDEFLKTKKRSEDLRVDVPHYAESYPAEERPLIKGYVYCGGYVIEDLGDGRLYLVLGNQEWIETDIAKLEPHLYEFARSQEVELAPDTRAGNMTFEQIQAWRQPRPEYGPAPADPLETRDALVIAFNEVKHEGAKATIAMLLQQRGCEHFDGMADYLTDLCDIAVFG